MRKKINDACYDTAGFSLIIDSEKMTMLAGKLSLKLCTADYIKNEISPMMNPEVRTIIKSPGEIKLLQKYFVVGKNFMYR